MPVRGTSFVLPPMMISVWSPRLAVSPTASRALKSSRASAAIRSPRKTSDHRETEQRERAEQAELLGDRGEDEVGVDERDRQVRRRA